MFDIVKPIPFGATTYPIGVAETESVWRELDQLLTTDEHSELIDFLAANPDFGDQIPGAGGIRKMPWRYGPRGNRGVIRIVYFFYDLNMPLYVLALYQKGESMRLTSHERKEMASLAQQLVNEYAVRIRQVEGGLA